MGETGSSKKKEDMHMHKKQIALLMAGLMTVSSLTMGSVTVMADDDPVELYSCLMVRNTQTLTMI